MRHLTLPVRHGLNNALPGFEPGRTTRQRSFFCLSRQTGNVDLTWLGRLLSEAFQGLSFDSLDMTIVLPMSKELPSRSPYKVLGDSATTKRSRARWAQQGGRTMTWKIPRAAWQAARDQIPNVSEL